MNYVIEMLNICKSFGTLKANDDITFQLQKGEVHALVGENGAGKSTLMSILFGLYHPDSGVIKFQGEEVSIKNPNDANRLKIGMVHQHFKLVDVFTVTENIILGMEETKNGFLTKENSRNRIIELREQYKLFVDPDAYIKDITVGMQQRVEILKMLYRDADILIFDEPTAVLTPQEIDELMNTIRNFKNEGKSIVIITHKLAEVMAVADRCTVLRKGKCIGTVNVKDVNVDILAEMMVGRKISFDIDKKPARVSTELFRTEKLSLFNSEKNKFDVHDVSFSVRGGEIVGIAGIEGNGQTELVNIITGLKNLTSGNIYFKDEDITKKSIRNKLELGIGHIPEDRHKHGLVLDFNLSDNLILQSYYLPEFQKHGFLKKNEIFEHANDLIKRFDIRSGAGAVSRARSMSGGNQQKAIIAREISRNPELLIAVQPTRGLDIGAIEYIHEKILEERDNGKGVLLISLELDEIMNLSDRILVIYEGQLVAELDPKKTSFQEIGLYMSGSKKGVINHEV
ncbi:MAG: heme ABC transporter ATP-binding protein [Tenericutes bacterium HGW-Tenericutes-1]|jgi:simple sugar transport system ATP-binding protein|nr:MAG: heme ABC transporter ATP-binding protein [Tenericutes bacterium HGW-Tenericutes-1]